MGRFRIGERIGSGGMGTVFRAFDERLEREVAIKEICSVGADRVLREALAAARLNHSAIVTLYELGERDGCALLVSELVHGQTLDEVAREGAISDRDVARIGTDMCDALEHAHKRGVIHRDIKPQNVMVRAWDEQGRRAKLMDFGIASVAGAEGLTATGEVVGTLAYMAPEQAEGSVAGPEADVYALALTLYEAWTGENPVARRTPAQTARQIGQPVEPLSEVRPDLPRPLTLHIDSCLAADPRNRPTVKRLHDAIKRVAPQLDDDCAVPDPEGDEESIAVVRTLPRIIGLVGTGVALAALAGPLALPGLALVLSALLAPALLFAGHPARALLPAAGALLGAAGAIAVAPALVALACRSAKERLVLGGLSFFAFVAAGAGAGLGDGAAIAARAPGGWTRSAPEALSGVLAGVIDPEALLGFGVLALAALALGALRPLHLALFAVAVILWAAGLAAGLAAVGDGSQAAGAVIAVVGVAVAIFARGIGLERPARAPGGTIPAARPALRGGGQAAQSL